MPVPSEPVVTEEHTLKGNMYFKNEVELMLKMAGFRVLTVSGDYGDHITTPEHQELVSAATG